MSRFYPHVIFLFTCFGLLTTACSNPPSITPTLPTLTSYQNDIQGFSVQYPATWHIRETTEGVIELRSDPTAELTANYQGGSIIQIISLPQLANNAQQPVELLESLRTDIAALIQSEDATATVVSNPSTTIINGQPAAGMLLSARQGAVDTYAEIYLVKSQDHAALMLLIYPQSQARRYRQELDVIVNRFQLRSS